jgi:hypothetical protein
MQTFDFTIPVGGGFNLSATGRFFRYDRGSAGGADESITVTPANGGGAMVLRPGMSVTLADDNTVWYLGNVAGGGTITGRLVVGGGSVQDSRVSGEVSVIDGAVGRVRAGQAFGANAVADASAGLVSAVQLWNPAGSGRLLVMDQVIAGSNVAGRIVFQTGNVAMSTLISIVSGNKLAAGASSVAERRLEVSAIPPAFATVGNFLVQAGASEVIKMESPVVMPPGTGFGVRHFSVNADVVASFQYYELPL